MANIKQKKIVNIPEDVCEKIRSGIVRHGKVKVNGLGIFETRKIPARPGRNPSTGEIVQIRAYYKIKFRPTKSLRDQILCKK